MRKLIYVLFGIYVLVAISSPQDLSALTYMRSMRKLIYVLFGIYVLGAISLFAGVTYVVVHFLAKFW